jgi:hypothetical protein
VTTFDQVGPNVVETGSGTLDITDLFVDERFLPTSAVVVAEDSDAISGPRAIANMFRGDITGSENYGVGGETEASSSSGDTAGRSSPHARPAPPYGFPRRVAANSAQPIEAI